MTQEGIREGKDFEKYIVDKFPTKHMKRKAFEEHQPKGTQKKVTSDAPIAPDHRKVL